MIMPPLDWIHIAMFIVGLVLQYLTHRVGSAASSATTGESKPLLELVHKLLDQRQPATPSSDPQALDALMGLLNKLLDQPKVGSTNK